MTEWRVEAVETDVDGFHLGPVDLTLAPGRAVAVLGSSGAGKTTLLRTLAGFLPVQRGRLLRDGEDISRWMPEERGLGYVPQGLGLFPQRTAFANVRYPLELRGRLDAHERTQELIERFHLTDCERRRPNRLSGGQQQRVALARALAAEPELIVWDEPWQALDVEARHELGAVLAELRATERIPIVVVTHDPALAFSLADSFLVLERGRPRYVGEATELIERPGDPFVARFVGYENVFERATLERERAHPFAALLLGSSGPAGVALGNPTATPTIGAPSSWEGAVRSVRPTPEGVRVELAVGALPVVVRLPRPWPNPLPAPGGRLRFNVDPVDLHPLGPTGAGA